LKKSRVDIFAHDSIEATANHFIGLRTDAFGLAATIL